MITRKIAKNILEDWYKHLKNEDANGLLCNIMGEVAFKDQLKKFIEQFPDVLTPDEMLEEMREWAITTKLEECNFSGWYSVCFTASYIDIEVERNTREEAITEAYRQWKEATSEDN